MAEYSIEELMAAPFLVDFLNHPAVVDFIQSVLGCVPTLYSIRAWWSALELTRRGGSCHVRHSQ